MDTPRVKRITFNADADLLAAAQKALGARTATDAINQSLAHVVRRQALQRLAGYEFPDLTPEALAHLRAPRTV